MQRAMPQVETIMTRRLPARLAAKPTQPNQKAAQARQSLKQTDVPRVVTDADQIEIQQNVSDAQQPNMKQQAVTQKQQNLPIQSRQPSWFGHPQQGCSS